MEFGKAFGAVTALEQERLALCDAAEIGGQVAGFACKNQRRIVGQFLLRGGKCGGVGVGRKLSRIVRAPAVRLPVLRHNKGLLRVSEEKCESRAAMA